MPRIVTLAACSLRQWAMDFEGNLNRIRQSIIEAKRRGAMYRLGPELEITGYGCNDHFYELDTFTHAWEALAELLSDIELFDIIFDVGLPVFHRNIRYNCRAVCFNGQILLLRPKKILANDGNYRETRWFTPWTAHKKFESYPLPDLIRQVANQETTIIGDVVLETNLGCFGFEMCEELFAADNPHVSLSLDGVEVFLNGSASHHQLRKLKKRIDLVCHATAKTGGVYLYANQIGCDGERLYYDGCSLAAVNGDLVLQGAQFSLADIDVVSVAVDLDDVQTFRSSIISRGMQAHSETQYHRVKCPWLPRNILSIGCFLKPIVPKIYSVEEEISLGPACWLWDYLRRSGAKGFFLCLSGGIDSCAVLLIVHSMCRLIVSSISNDKQVAKDVQNLVADHTYIPKTPEELANRFLFTCYMSSQNSTTATKARAGDLAKRIGSHHINVPIDGITNALLNVVSKALNVIPRFKSEGGTTSENLALQNIQSRSRMVLAYLFAQLLPWAILKKQGSLLVLGTSNVDECLRGYFTKYDCSSADLNPIGSIAKSDLKKFVQYAESVFQMPQLKEFLEATPSAELEPVSENFYQSDEMDMGMSYDELNIYAQLRKIYLCGPVSMYLKLRSMWTTLSSSEVANKVKHFFRMYAINRHKMTTLTPAYHAENYSPDDNRFDLRPFLYSSNWTWQFRKIDEDAARH